MRLRLPPLCSPPTSRIHPISVEDKPLCVEDARLKPSLSEIVQQVILRYTTSTPDAAQRLGSYKRPKKRRGALLSNMRIDSGRMAVVTEMDIVGSKYLAPPAARTLPGGHGSVRKYSVIVSVSSAFEKFGRLSLSGTQARRAAWGHHPKSHA